MRVNISETIQVPGGLFLSYMQNLHLPYTFCICNTQFALIMHFVFLQYRTMHVMQHLHFQYTNRERNTHLVFTMYVFIITVTQQHLLDAHFLDMLVLPGCKVCASGVGHPQDRGDHARDQARSWSNIQWTWARPFIDLRSNVRYAHAIVSSAHTCTHCESWHEWDV
jgi:hypothetical protein